MAQITWRDVATPDFSSAVNGFAQFSKILGDGLGSLKSGVTGFDQSKSDLVNNQLALALAQMPDVNARRAAVAAGQVGGLDITSPDFASRASAANIAALGPDAMTALDKSQMDLQQAHRADNQHVAQDAQAPLVARAYNDLRSPDPEARARGLATLSSIDYSKTGLKFVEDLNSNAQSTESRAISNDSSAFNLGNSKEDRANETAADGALSYVRERALSGEDARSIVNDPKGPFAGLNPRARALAESKLSSAYPDVFSTGASAAIAGAVGGAPAVAGGGGGAFTYDAPQQAVAGTLTAGGLPTPVVAGFLGNFQSEGGYGGGKGDGGSASGIAQWRNERRANFKAQFGKDPHEATPEEQAKFVVWEMNNPTKAGMTVAQRDAILAAKTPEEAAALIDQHFERSDGKTRGDRVSAASLAMKTFLAQNQVKARDMQDTAHGVLTDFAQTINDNASVGEVAARLANGNMSADGKSGSPGVFRGTSRGFLVDQLNKIMAEGRVNAATAGAILTRNIGGSKEAPWWDVAGNVRNTINRGRGGTPALGGGVSINDAGVANDIKLFKEKGLSGVQSMIAAQADRAQVSGQLQLAQSQLNAAQAEYTNALMRLPTMPQLKEMLPRYQAKVQAAKQAVQMIQAQTQADPYKPG